MPLKGLKEATKNMKLVNTDGIAEQGKRAYRMGIELNNNPHKRELEHTVWERGWKSARDVWFALLRRNDGTLGMKQNITNNVR